MRTQGIVTTFILSIVCWGSAAAQTPAPEPALDRIVTELRMLRQLAEKQMAQTVQIELIRARVMRLSDLQRRLDQVNDERESENRVLQNLSQTRNTAAEEDRVGIDRQIQELTARVNDLVRREAALRADIQTSEQTLNGYWNATSPAAPAPHLATGLR
jgi:predicted RNase H-like nuclease (RuvC/YqgF family)